MADDVIYGAPCYPIGPWNEGRFVTTQVSVARDKSNPDGSVVLLWWRELAAPIEFPCTWWEVEC